MKIDNLKSKVSKLSINQRKDLIEFIKNSYSIFSEYAHVEKCPYCGSSHIVKNGTRKEITRFLCRDCKKSFTYKSSTILQGLQKLTKWNSFVEDFLTLNISTIKEITKKLSISTQTAINWRHKLLSALVSKETTFNNETIEFDEAFFLISRKGRKNLGITNKRSYKYWRKSQTGESDYKVKLFMSFSRDSKQLDLTVSHMGRTKLTDLQNYFTPNRFNNIVAVTDKHPTYKGFFTRNDIEFKTFLSTDHVNPDDNTIHNQNINAYTREFRNFVNKHMKGVSTKYLPFYAKWFEFIMNSRKKMNEIKKMKFDLSNEICNNVVTDLNGLEMFRQSEFSFNQFLKINGRTIFGDCKNHYYFKVA